MAAYEALMAAKTKEVNVLTKMSEQKLGRVGDLGVVSTWPVRICTHCMISLHREGVFLTPPCLLEWQYHAQPRSRMVSARHFADSVARCLLT